MLTDKLRELDSDGEITEAIADKKFKPIIKNGVWIGFLTWKEHWVRGRRHVFVRNLFISPEYRSRENLLFLMKFFRNLYKKDYQYVFWHDGKHNKFYYGR